MARHQHFIDRRFNPESSPTCTLCGKDEETTAHIISQCEELQELREKHFGNKWLSPPYDKLKMQQVINFFREVPLEGVGYFFESANKEDGSGGEEEEEDEQAVRHQTQSQDDARDRQRQRDQQYDGT